VNIVKNKKKKRRRRRRRKATWHEVDLTEEDNVVQAVTTMES
jgi:hypothetical protein